MDINHSRRVLVIGAPNAGVLDVIKDLTGSKPALNESGTTAGLIHEWNIKTPYYSVNVPIWIDEIPDLAAWETEFSKPEAKEVVEALGAWIYCFRSSEAIDQAETVEQTMKAIQRIGEEHAGLDVEVVMLAVAVPDEKASKTTNEASFEDWEDTALQYSFEFIDLSASGKNEFGEKVGVERMREALEANEWSYAGAAGEDDIDIDDLDFASDDADGLGRDEAEMTAELFGMKAALMGNDGLELEAEDFLPAAEPQAQEVDDLDRMMGRILAIKESSAGLPEAQRKKMAARAVRELLKQGSASKP